MRGALLNLLRMPHVLQEWNEIQYNGVYWEPPLGPGKPGVLEEGKSYTFKYPRPPR